MTTDQTRLDVCSKLKQHKEDILIYWELLVREAIDKAQHESSIILQNQIPDIIDQLILILERSEVSDEELGRSHGTQRLILTDYTVDDLQTEFSLLREAIIQYLYPFGDLRLSLLFHKYLDIIYKHSINEFFNDYIQTGRIKKDRHVIGSENNDLIKSTIINFDHKIK